MSFSPFSMLDPALLRAEFNASQGSDVIDGFGLLDPILAEAQVNAALGPTFRVTGPLSRGITDPSWGVQDLADALEIT